MLKSKRKLFGTPWIIWIVMNSVGDVPVTPCCTKLNPQSWWALFALHVPSSVLPVLPRSPLPASLRDLGNQTGPAGFKPFERYIDQLGIIPNIRNMNIYIYTYIIVTSSQIWVSMVEHLQLWLWRGFKIQVGTFRVGSDFISCCVSFLGDQIWLLPMSEGWVVWVLHLGYIQGSSKQQQSRFFSTTKQIMKHILTYYTHFNPWMLYIYIYVGIWWYMMVFDGIWWYMMVYDGIWWYMMYMIVYDGIWWYMIYVWSMYRETKKHWCITHHRVMINFSEQQSGQCPESIGQLLRSTFR